MLKYFFSNTCALESRMKNFLKRQPPHCFARPGLMPRSAAFCLALCTVAFAAEPGAVLPMPGFSSFIHAVQLKGSDARPDLETRPGDHYDADVVSKDVRALWSSGRYDDIRVEAVPQENGTLVVFHVVEKPKQVLRDFRIDPHSYGLQVHLQPGTPMDRARAQQVAMDFRKRLLEQGYTDADVEPELIPAGKNKVDLHLKVTAGEPTRVKAVQFVGEAGLDPKAVRQALHALRIRRVLPGVPGVWAGWRLFPAYSPDAVQSDLGRIRSLYFSQGYFDATARLEKTITDGPDATVVIYLNPGQRYHVRQWEVARAGAKSILMKPARDVFASGDLCACLFAARRDAEKRGVIDFSVRLAVNRVDEGDGTEPEADLTATVSEGRSYTVGRIEFIGREKFSEAVIRRNLLLNESDVLDQMKLRKSVARLNRTGFFEPMDVSNVQIVTNGASSVADLRVHVREAKRGLWNISGPVGPVKLAGPFQGSIARRLPAWGSGILELSTYYASFSLIGFPASFARLLPITTFHGFAPILSVQRPFIPGDGWRSGFTIAPQLGWQAMLLSYGATQIGQRIAPLLIGDSKLTPELPVMVERPNGDGELLCEPPKPRLAKVRMGAALLLQFVSAMPVL
jgi:outer membrane protein insertion porin family